MMLKEWQCPRCNKVNSKPDYVLRLARLHESLGLIGIGTSTEPAPRCSQCDYEAGINALLDGKYDTRDENIPAPASKLIEKTLAAPLDKPAKTDRLALIVVGVIAAVLVCGICAWSIGGGIYLSRISGKEFPLAFLTSTSTLTPTPVPTQTPPFTPTSTTENQVSVSATEDQMIIWNAFVDETKYNEWPVVFYTRREHPVKSLEEIVTKDQFAVCNPDYFELVLQLFGYKPDDDNGLHVSGGQPETLDDPNLRIYLAYEIWEEELSSYGWVRVQLVER